MPLMTNERIIITGFMGSGKTTVARALSRLLECEMSDLDDVITREEQRAPWQIIEADGEPAFREIETRVLENTLEHHGARVIALGGGAWTLPRNRDLIRSQGAFTVWLDAPFDLCWNRIQESGGNRPLAGTESETRTLFDERLSSYKLADLIINTEKKSTDEIAAEIVAKTIQAQATRQI